MGSAALGYGIASAIEENQNFNDCMQAKGWRVVDEQQEAQQKAVAQQHQIVNQITAIQAQQKECVSAVRNKPQYAILATHHRGSFGYTMKQLADESLPTIDEASAMSSYYDETNHTCVQAYIEAGSKLVPALGPISQHAMAATDEATLLLVQRKISWGTYAQKINSIIDEGDTQIKLIRLDGSLAPPPQTAANVTTRAPLDVRGTNVTPAIAASVHLREPRGVMITSVGDNSVGARAGLLKGDIILTFNDQPIYSDIDIKRALDTIQPSSRVVATIWRNETEVWINVQF
jgi:hypothetical protein